MGDRCYLSITLRRCDVDAFNKATEEDLLECGAVEGAETTDDSGTVTVEMDEANYGWYNQREAAAKAGIKFFGHQGEGGDYGACDFVSDGSGEELAVAVNREGNVVVSVNDKGRASDFELANVRKFNKVLAAAKKELGQ